MKPVVLQKLVMRDWETGCVLNEYKIGKATPDNIYYMFHRQDMHKGLLHAATAQEGRGVPCKFVIGHTWDCPAVVYVKGTDIPPAARASTTRPVPSLLKTGE